MAKLSLKVGLIFFYLERLKLLTEINKELNLLLLNVSIPWFMEKYITLI